MLVEERFGQFKAYIDGFTFLYDIGHIKNKFSKEKLMQYCKELDILKQYILLEKEQKVWKIWNVFFQHKRFSFYRTRFIIRRRTIINTTEMRVFLLSSWKLIEFEEANSVYRLTFYVTFFFFLEDCSKSLKIASASKKSYIYPIEWNFIYWNGERKMYNYH